LCIGEIVQSLEYEHFEHQHVIERGSPAGALRFLGEALLELAAEHFPVDGSIEPLKWISLATYECQSILLIIESALLVHGAILRNEANMLALQSQ